MNIIQRSAFVCFGLLALNFATGCVYSVHPLSDAKTSEPDLRLVGTWEIWDPQKEPKEVSTLEIVQKKDSPNVLVATDESEGKKETMELLTTKIGKDHYMSIVVEDEKKKDKRYVIMKYEISDDSFKYRGLQHKFFSDAVEAKKIKGAIEENKVEGGATFTDVMLSATTDELRKFIEAHGEKCLDDENVFSLKKLKKAN